MSPQSHRHFNTIQALFTCLVKLVGIDGDKTIRPQGPLALSDADEPEPDLSVVQGNFRTLEAHPDTALLVVEVSDSSLMADRTVKTSLYARFAIPEYWIVNLQDRLLEVHREPMVSRAVPAEARYGQVTTLGPEGTVTPLFLAHVPEANIAVGDFLI